MKLTISSSIISTIVNSYEYDSGISVGIHSVMRLEISLGNLFINWFGHSCKNFLNDSFEKILR